MAKYQIKSKTQKSYKQNPAKETIIPKNCVAVFPMLIVSGSTYITEHGTMPQNLTYDKGSFLFGQEVFDGRHSIKIQWDDAILLEKPEGKNYYLAETKVGKYFFGKPISNTTESLDIGDDQSYEEFITMRANQTCTIRFEFQKSNRLMFDNLREDLRFVDNDLYKLYLIPELCEGKLMYISDYEEGYDDASGMSYWCEITFQTLGNELQKSGKAVEQYPQWSAPGEFYVKPKIEYSVGEKQEKRITIDPQGLHPNGIKYLQVELQGPALTSCMYALGRRQEKDPETGKGKIGASHHLLGVNFVSTQPNPLNRTSTPTKNYDCFFNEEVCFATNAEFLQLMTDKLSQPLEQMKNGGLISLGMNTDWDNVASGIHKSNNPEDNNGSRFDYYDNTGRPLGNFDNLTVNTNGCVYAEENMTYNKDSDRMIDIMNKNVFTFNQQPVIPLSMYATRPFYLRNIPLIGSIANFFSLGDIHLFNNTTNRQTSNLIFFGDADLMAICANLQQGMIQANGKPFKTSGKVAFPINFFGNNESSYNKLGVNSVNTTFCIELTDLISMTPSDLPQDIYNTIYLGQSTDENGTPFYLNDPKRTLLVNGTMKAQEALNTTYIIDAVVVQTIFDGKIRMSCYTDQDNEFLIPAGTTTILSNASGQGGAMRDGTNMYILSNGTDRFCRQQDEFTGPLPPHKQSANEVVLNVNMKSDFRVDTPSVLPQPAGFDSTWSLTLGKYRDIDKSNYVVRTKNFDGSSYRVAYTDLAIEEVVDRESFLNYFENIAINMQGSYQNLDFREHRTGTSGQHFGNELWKTIGSFKQGVFSYDFELPIISIGNVYEGSGLNDNGPEQQLHVRDQTFAVEYSADSGKTNGVLIMSIRIELNENEIVITATDKSIWGGFDMYTPHGIGEKAGIQQLIYGAKYISLLQFNQIKFSKRGNGTCMSNRRYGVKHTETPLKSTKSKK